MYILGWVSTRYDVFSELLIFQSCHLLELVAPSKEEFGVKIKRFNFYGAVLTKPFISGTNRYCL